MAFFEDDPIVLPSEAVCKSLGFSFDAGGSDTKVVYRSKKDYNQNKAINTDLPQGKGILRTAHFNSSQTDELIDFLEKECDIDNTITEKTASVTGIYTEWIVTKIKDRLGVSLSRKFEFDFMMKAFRFLCQHQEIEELLYPEDEQAIQDAQKIVKAYTAYTIFADQFTDGGMFADVDKDKFPESEDTTENNCLKKPLMFAQLGSAITMHKIEEDWSYNMIELGHFGGRSFLGLSTAIFGENKSYDELMKIAEAGESRKVDVYAADCKMKQTDVYTELPEHAYFLFGKAAFESKDNFTKEDIMASWANAMCYSLAQYTHAVTLAHGINRVVMAGGFCNHRLARKLLTKHWHSRLLHAKGKKIDLHFLKIGSFLPALGAYLTTG